MPFTPSPKATIKSSLTAFAKAINAFPYHWAMETSSGQFGVKIRPLGEAEIEACNYLKALQPPSVPGVSPEAPFEEQFGDEALRLWIAEQEQKLRDFDAVQDDKVTGGDDKVMGGQGDKVKATQSPSHPVSEQGELLDHPVTESPVTREELVRRLEAVKAAVKKYAADYIAADTKTVAATLNLAVEGGIPGEDDDARVKWLTGKDGLPVAPRNALYRHIRQLSFNTDSVYALSGFFSPAP